MENDSAPRFPKFPEPVGKLFDDLWQDVASLHLKWKTYIELFGDAASVAVLNATGSAFFQIVEESLRADMIMSFSRLLDPPRSVGKDNLSLIQLIRRLGGCCDAALCASLTERLQRLKDQCAPITKWRNRRISHNDLATVLQYHPESLPQIGRRCIEEGLQMLAGFMNEIDKYYRDGETVFHHPVVRGGARDVLFYLERGTQYEQEKRDALLKGLETPAGA